MTNEIVHVFTLKQFKQLLATESRNVIIKASSTWCGPCKMIAPFYKMMAESPLSEYVCFAELDTDEAEDLAEYLNISAMPSFIAFVGKTRNKTLQGANKEKLAEFVKKVAMAK
jgi:thioredoxin 1